MKSTKTYRSCGRRLLAVTLMLSVLGLAGCLHRTVVMPEARAVAVKAGQPMPFDGWAVSESAMAKLLEAAEKNK
jgi:hypothetical protein